MNIKNIFFISLMIGIICILPSCQKSCKESYEPLASQLQKYSFETGSYWVYQDSTSGIIDSQSVFYYYAQSHVQYSSTPNGNGSWCSQYSDIFGMSIASFWNGVLHDSIGFSNNAEPDPSYMFVLYSSYISQADLYGYPTFSGNQSLTLNNFTVSGQTFPTVTVFVDNSGFNSLMYHVDNVGVVKWVFNDSINGQHTWNLLRYHVINP